MKRNRRDREAGMSVLEVVLLAPFIIGFIMLLVGFGVLVDARGTIQGAARDAARMGSLQRDDGSANSAATSAAQADGLDGLCNGANGWHLDQIDPDTKAQTNAFAPGELYTVRITCDVSLGALNWFNIGDKTFVTDATAPLDVFRRTTP